MYIPHSKPYIIQELIDNVEAQLSSQLLSRGKRVEEFEERLGSYLHGNKVYLTPSGTAAIYIALRALQLGAGDEVVLPTYVCHTVADAIILAGAKPVFCDIGETWVMEPSHVQTVITSHTKAIIVVNIFGIYANTSAFKEFGIPIIEDNCQCFINKMGNDLIGKDADFVVFSFQATKCLTTGEGGAVICNNPDFQLSLENLYAVYRPIYTFSDVQAALGLNQLNSYEYMLSRRTEIATSYFRDLPTYLTRDMNCVKASMFFRFVLRSAKPFELVRTAFHEKNIAVRKGVDELLHQRYKQQGNFSKAEQIFATTISIPIYPALTNNEVEKIVEVTNEVLS